MLISSGNLLAVTCELPWADNRRKVSCIPQGNYVFNHFKSPRHGHVWLADDVPDRDMIEIHAANTIADLEGCIAPGKRLGFLNGRPAVLDSRLAMAELLRILPDTFELQIRNAWHL